MPFLVEIYPHIEFSEEFGQAILEVCVTAMQSSGAS